MSHFVVIRIRIDRLTLPPNQRFYLRRLASSERGVRVVTNVGCGMRWTLERRKTSGVLADGRSRVVVTPRRWRQVGGSTSAGDGGKRARSPGRARSKP